MKQLIVLLVVALLTAGCLGGASDTTIKALQTQVAELSAEKAQPTVTPAATKAISLPTVTTALSSIVDAAGGIPASEDEAAFCLLLATAMEDAGWTISETYDDGLDVESPSGRLYILQYSYGTEDVSRIILFSLWSGVGESNLSCETLTAINELNDTYNLAKVSVDEDGDVWIETVYPFGKALDVKAWVDYLEWFEEAEDVLVYDYLADYLQ